ncbi:MAG: manganese-dependent inorganic pyrophosphatase, partial [Candidatus Moranbacteria bacterium]|nr:manganese-dependent inorganic pyrophosphatase [Candidatus Moranbacteria bacterium]
MNIIVIGHINPDTDSIVSAIALAQLLNQEGKEAQAFFRGNLNKESQWVLDNFQARELIEEINEVLESKEVFFVDFNEADQCPFNPGKIKLVGLIDHHKLRSNWRTEEPILFRIEPVGASSTLIAKLFREKNIPLPDNLAKMLLCGIISDTLNLTSPTTTEEDRSWVGELSEQTNENVGKLANNLFEAKSDLSSFTPQEIAKLDYKVFNFSGKKVGLGVIETVRPDNAKKIEAELKKTISEIKSEEGLDYIYLGIVDILNNKTELLIASEEAKKLARKAFPEGTISKENLILEGIVSRKKQMVPALERALLVPL